MTDPNGIMFTIYQNKTLKSVGEVILFDFGTAVEGIYSFQIRIYCQVEAVNVAYAVAEDYKISTVHNGSNPDPDPINPDPTNSTNPDGYYYSPIEWTIGFGLCAGVVVAVVAVLGATKRKKDSVSLKSN